MTRTEILDAAVSAVDGEREEIYGGPEDSFQLIATFWNVYLESRLVTLPGTLIRPHDVALMMDLLKTARLMQSDGKHKDSWVDKAGYAACGAECVK